MNIYETKNIGKIIEELFAPPPHTPPPPPHTHTHLSGGGLLELPCTQRKLLMGAKLFSGSTQYQKFFLSPKIDLFGLHKIAWYPWQPIGHCSWVICKQTQGGHLRASHFFMDFFSLPVIQEKQAVSYWRNKMVVK